MLLTLVQCGGGRGSGSGGGGRGRPTRRVDSSSCAARLSDAAQGAVLGAGASLRACVWVRCGVCAPGHRLALGDGDGAGGERQLAAVAAQLHRGRVGAEGQHQGRSAGQGNAQRVLRVTSREVRQAGFTTKPRLPARRAPLRGQGARGRSHAADGTPSQEAVPARAGRLHPTGGEKSSLLPLCPGSIHTATRGTPPPQAASRAPGTPCTRVGFVTLVVWGSASSAHLLQGRHGGDSHAGGRHAGLGRRHADAGEGGGLGEHLCVCVGEGAFNAFKRHVIVSPGTASRCPAASPARR